MLEKEIYVLNLQTQERGSTSLWIRIIEGKQLSFKHLIKWLTTKIWVS